MDRTKLRAIATAYSSQVAFRQIAPSLVALFLCGFPMLALAQQGQTTKTQPATKPAQPSIPTNLGLPGRRQSASPRGPCFPNQKPVIALMPATNLGLTVAAHPTFFFYVPQTSAAAVEFVLLDEENYKEVYQKTFTIAPQSGIVSFSLPASEMPPLKIGKNYHWYFSLICDPEDRAGDFYVDGWVQRVELSPTLMSELGKASLLDRAALYQKYGLWQETLTTLARGRNSRPGDRALAAEWATLLRSVGLDRIAQEPLVNSHRAPGD